MRRSWLIGAIVLGVVAIAIAAIISRVRDDSGGRPSASAWADSVCTSLSTWKASITSLADVGGGTLTPELLRQKIDAAESATSRLVTELKDLGPPDLEAGDQLEQQLDTSASGLQSSVETLKEGVDEATQAGSAGSSAAFLQSLAKLAPRFQALLDQTSATVDDLQNANVGEDAKAELERAFADSSACRQLRANG